MISTQSLGPRQHVLHLLQVQDRGRQSARPHPRAQGREELRECVRQQGVQEGEEKVPKPKFPRPVQLRL